MTQYRPLNQQFFTYLTNRMMEVLDSERIQSVIRKKDICKKLGIDDEETKNISIVGNVKFTVDLANQAVFFIQIEREHLAGFHINGRWVYARCSESTFDNPLEILI